MPRFIIKLVDEKFNKINYLEWSTIVDAPVTAGMSINEFRDYYRMKYGTNNLSELDERLRRTDECGCSSMVGDTIHSLIECNRAGPNETCLNKEELLEEYCRKYYHSTNL